jgi:two-component system LytT family response regulator
VNPGPGTLPPLRVLIVDDEAPARQRLMALLAGDPEIDAAACEGGRQAIAAITQARPQLVFLDVQMPEIDGWGVIQTVGQARMPPVIFVTAFEEHAVHAFEISALDYLLKPFDRARFEAALDRAKMRIRGAVNPPDMRPLDRLLVPDGAQIHVLKTESIDWIEAAGNYVEVHVGTRVYLLRSPLGALEGRLDPQHFLRIHRDTIVHLDRIRGIRRWRGRQDRVLLDHGVERPIGRSHQDALERRLGKL